MQKENNFKKYVSNTFAGTLNNYILKWDSPKTVTGRIYYKVCEGGEFDYKFLFSNKVDSTFDNGSIARADLSGDDWKIISAFAGSSPTADPNTNNVNFTHITFNGIEQKNVLAGELFWSDAVKLNIPNNHYLFFEWTVSGNNIPFTPDKITPSFVKVDNDFLQCEDFPQPNLVACNRNVKKRIAFLGDSITQGLGTRYGYYEFWVAQIGKFLGNDFSVWNLGLGCGRAEDAAKNGVWLNKAKQLDLVSVCFGVNDILHGRSKQDICCDLKKIIITLKQAGCQVGIFTVPPFSMVGDTEQTWRDVNNYIVNELSVLCDYVFDTVLPLGMSAPNDNIAAFGEHPNADGCTALAKSFNSKIKLFQV